MMWIVWRMLIGNRGKYIGIISGITFASLLIAQQSSIFCGLMLLTTKDSFRRDGHAEWQWVNLRRLSTCSPVTVEPLNY